MIKKILLMHVFVLSIAVYGMAQTEPGAGNWKPWLIPSGKTYRLPPPPSYKGEIAQVLAAQNNLDATAQQKIVYWNAGAPGYRWYSMVSKLWMTDITGNGALANMLIGTAIYDATIAAWDSKYAYNRARPFATDNKVKLYGPRPESPSYPCEHSVAAGAAVALISHFYPAMADSANRMAQQVMASRIAAGCAFPSDTKAGFELGKRIAEKHIELTKDFISKKQWDGKMPQDPGLWKGKNPMLPLTGLNKTMVLDSASQFRPGPPPDFSKDMEELKSFKQTFRSKANAFYYASQPTGDDLISKKVFEYNLHLNPPRAARVYAAMTVAYYDAFTACFDAKYAYWGTRPDQYDPNYKPLFASPPFPGYPSGHAVMSGVVGELYPYFFPLEKELFNKIATEGAESRFHAGIHFRTDNDAGLVLGRKVAAKIVERVRGDGADGDVRVVVKK
ncbi:vanadium-dependent haloperoxidase [Fulvivirgaceae bacterium PWU4]|uniref:Vanadium-dependent haloperoxidase n=1 Tax=Chryseosolibacter histidini TaxID=2782349 RepID=A0AAP2DNI8_9BACT|nr:vanadium-dependent haloperoxidase [Chryseosolibacter histidini]MBT1698719.1 vanadium-dependent haloperoxidase [Chryseosolibacter histidini]